MISRYFSVAGGMAWRLLRTLVANPALFLSSMSLPRNLIENDWFQTVATWNPVSYMLEGIRSLVLTGWDPEALALGFACAGGLALIALAAASSALRTRMVRT